MTQTAHPSESMALNISPAEGLRISAKAVMSIGSGEA